MAESASSSSQRWPGYDALVGRLVRAPILRAFGDARAPDETRRWVGAIGRWPFRRIVTSHFASPVAATPAEFVGAFGWLFGKPTSVDADADAAARAAGRPPRGALALDAADWATLDGRVRVAGDWGRRRVRMSAAALDHTESPPTV